MSKKIVVPDAWDDDWITQADKTEDLLLSATIEDGTNVTKAERLAKHAETNKKIWKNADEPETFHFLAARDTVPLKSDFKPALKVLSRKPAPKTFERIDPVTGLARVTVEDEDDEGEDKAQPTVEELRLKAQREREEKRKRYDEARARILGISGASSPGTASPPTEEPRMRRSNGRGRGIQRGDTSRPTSQPRKKELFDPGYSPKPAMTIQKRDGEGQSTPKGEDQIIRAPRGPDGSGRGGFGFTNRGRKS